MTFQNSPFISFLVAKTTYNITYIYLAFYKTNMEYCCYCFMTLLDFLLCLLFNPELLNFCFAMYWHLTDVLWCAKGMKILLVDLLKKRDQSNSRSLDLQLMYAFNEELIKFSSNWGSQLLFKLWSQMNKEWPRMFISCHF